ncbi:MAG TPA: saccharopine dehydrogenase NADP-binding domain-containing protein [Pseudonocardiaceae bacterium]|nr:saccharopine dehydrogenase NADP-binding domain-containing protein [Pseudonocardiaceae bacterium]
MIVVITQRIGFSGRILLLGCGSVSQCLQPLLLRHVDMPFDRLTVLDFEDLRDSIPETLAVGAHYVRRRITPDNLASTLGEYLVAGDMLINLSWNIGAENIITWCHYHGVLYVDTSVEQWDPYADMGARHPAERTLYARHLALQKTASGWADRGPTAVVEHGANPGLVSHWTKVALEDLATAMLTSTSGLARPLSAGRQSRIEQALHDADYARLAMETGTKIIHISERDTQISDRPKEVGEFVNTWSIEGFYEEGVAPAELGWGTHENKLPPKAVVHENGPGNQICLAQPGMTTWVRSWVPSSGPILGLLIRHGEAFTISDHLTVRHDGVVTYRPTVHYAYLPTDAASASVHECWMQGFRLQQRQRIMTDEITSGMDELGVLLLGHDLNGWWTGSQLTIEETRSLVPHQNATTLQVAASVLAAVFYLVRHPAQGLCVPDDLDHRETLAIADPYLGPCPSIPTDWTPTQTGPSPFDEFLGVRRSSDVWQFSNILVS